MKNFMALASQLVQREISMYCDEGVYCLVKEIQMMRPQEFCNLVPVMGTFHLVKFVLKCIGKAPGGSRADVTWLQTGVFGPTIIQNSILNGGHYSHALEGMQFIAEAFNIFSTRNSLLKKVSTNMPQSLLSWKSSSQVLQRRTSVKVRSTWQNLQLHPPS